MKVLIYGDYSVGRLGSSYKRAFEALGHEVVPFDFRRRKEFLPRWVLARGFRSFCEYSFHLRKWVGKAWNAKFLQNVESVDPDFVFVIAGDFLMPESVRRIRKLGIGVALFFPDSPLPGSPNHLPEHLPLAKEASTIFIWSRTIQRCLKKRGLGNIAYLPFAWDPSLHPFSGVRTEESDERVVFVGGWDSWRENWLRPVAEHFDLKIWGPDYWRTRCKSAAVRECWQGRAVYGEEVSSIYRNAAVSLNILRKQNLPDGTNMRTFEICGSGGTMLSSRSPGATEIYPEQDAAMYFDETEELLTALQNLLSSSRRRASLSHTAHRITQAHHRYVDRVESIIAKLNV